jgi:HNH endonuclease
MTNANYIVSTKYDGKPRKLYRSDCEVCGGPVWAPAHAPRKYCSVACRGVARRGQRVAIACRVCSTTLWKSPRQIQRSKSGAFFCSRTCKDYAQSLRGGCKEIQPSHYGTAKVAPYRNLIPIERCGCGITDKRVLLVHHVDGDRTNNGLENLEVVCHNCHALRHQKQRADGTTFYSTASITGA